MNSINTTKDKPPVASFYTVGGILVALIILLGWAFFSARSNASEASTEAEEAKAAAALLREEADRAEEKRAQAVSLVRLTISEVTETLASMEEPQASESFATQMVAFFDKLPSELATPELALHQADMWRVLGNARSQLKSTAGAIAAHRQGLSILEKLAEDTPEDSLLQSKLSRARLETGKVFTRAERFQDARNLFRAVAQVEKDEAFLAEAELGLGEIEGHRKNYKVGLRYCSDAVERAEKYLEQSPNDMKMRQVVARAYDKAGVYATEVGNDRLAEISYRSALKNARKLVSLEPERSALKKQLARVLNDYGVLLQKQERYHDALSALNEGFGIREKLEDWSAQDPQWLADLANAWSINSLLGYKKGDAPATFKAAKNEVYSYRSLVSRYPENQEWIDLLVSSFRIESDRLSDLGARKPAQSIGKSVENVLQALSTTDPENESLRKALVDIRSQMKKIQ